MKKLTMICALFVAAVCGFQANAAMWLVGDAFNGWNESGNVQMTQSGNIYSYEANLVAGKYFAFFKDTQGWSYQRGPMTNDAAPTGDWEATKSGGAWKVATSGTYTIEYNYSTDQAKIAVKQAETFDATKRKFAVTGAAFGGWNMPPAAAQTFTNNGDGTYTLVYEGATASEFKLSGVGINDEFDTGWSVFNSGAMGKSGLVEGNNALSTSYGSGNMNFPVSGNVTLTISNVTESSCNLNIAVNQVVIPDPAYYLIGEFNNWNENNMEEFSENKGVFTLVKTFSGQFKIKDENGNWLGGGGENDPYVLHKDWPSVTLEAGHNLQLEEEAEYTLTIENGVLTVSGFPEEPTPDPALTLKGSFDDWGDGEAMELNEENGTFSITKTLDANAEIKFVDENGTWYGAQSEGNFVMAEEYLGQNITLAQPGENIQFPVAGEWTIIVDKANGYVIINGEWPVEPTPDPALTLKGSFDDWGAGEPMVLNEENGTFSITKALDANAEIKFIDENGDWYGAESNGNFIMAEEYLGQPLTLAHPGENIQFPVAGEWIITVDKTNGTIFIDGEWPEDMITVAGKVIDNLGESIEGVKVTVSLSPLVPENGAPRRVEGEDTFTGYTDSEGQYSVEVPDRVGVTYGVSFEKEGFQTQQFDNLEVPDVIEMAPATPTAVEELMTAKPVASVKYVNLTGATSNEPFDGLNIVIVNYTDGTKAATKVVK